MKTIDENLEKEDNIEDEHLWDDDLSSSIEDIFKEEFKMINELIKLATHLDKCGLRKEADYLDSVIKKLAQTTDPPAGEVFDTSKVQGNTYYYVPASCERPCESVMATHNPEIWKTMSETAKNNMFVPVGEFERA